MTLAAAWVIICLGLCGSRGAGVQGSLAKQCRADTLCLRPHCPPDRSDARATPRLVSKVVWG